jgi:lysophospholipase L1-like esterase
MRRTLAVTLGCAMAVCGATTLLRAAAAPAATADAKNQASTDQPASVTPKQKDPRRHEQFLKDKEAALQKGPVQLVFIGDSITDAWRGGPQHRVYQERWGKYNPLNLGISGDETEHVLWRLEHGEIDGLRPKVVVMMIGTNNLGNPRPPHTSEQTARGIGKLVETIRAKLPESKLLLLAVFPRGEKPDNKFRDQIKQVNDRIARLDDGGRHVRYLDIGPKFLEPDGTLPKSVMPDALHPNPKGYEIWADAIGPVIEEMMKG